jgi:dihydrofolate synthase/folylpolyglutamate synthase
MHGSNQLINAACALAALETLHKQLPVTAQAVRMGLVTAQLPGRFQVVSGRDQPTLVLDVAHNPHAAVTLMRNLDAMGFFPINHAVFGAMGDKNYSDILKCLDPLIDYWYFTDLPTTRAASAAQLQQAWRQVSRNSKSESKTFVDPNQALEAAVNSARPVDRITVLGSFYTVGSVLQRGVSQLTAGRPNPSGK